MRNILAYVLTYALASFMAIAGMGAAGMLIPNYVTLGLSLPLALTYALTQNVFELSVVTALNHLKRLIDWGKVLVLSAVAVAFVPLGFYIHMHIPHLAVLVVFELFLLYTLYSLMNPSRKLNIQYSDQGLGLKQLALAATQGLIAGTIGMDAAPIAILAYSTLHSNPKIISANTAATSLLVSMTTWILYVHAFYQIASPNIISLIIIALSGLLGGVTGAKLMHIFKPASVKLGMKILLSLATLEVYLKILSMTFTNMEMLITTQTTIITTILILAIKYTKQWKVLSIHKSYNLN
jgi:uncharacterized membrane protein YfcA